MPADMELQVVASLLRRGRSLDQLSTGLTLRVAFDADLFALLARDTTRTPDLDEALQTLGLQSPKRAGRPWTERRRGALKLLRKQAWLLGAQALLTLGVILASPWLPFAG